MIQHPELNTHYLMKPIRVVKVKDFEYVGNYPMIVMEWLDGDAIHSRTRE